MPYFIMILLLITSVSCKKDNTNAQGQGSSFNTVIPNYDFENWTSKLPDNWKTNSCPMCVPSWNPYIAQQDSQIVYHGKYSLKLIYNLIFPSWVESKFAISQHPSSLHGYVKCNLYGTDTVSIKIKLLNNSLVVDSGEWSSTTAINSWTAVNIPISHTTSTIDSVLILIVGGKYKDSTTNFTNSTTFWVDDLSLNLN